MNMQQSSPPRRTKKRFIVARKVGDEEFAEFAGKMERQGLDPIFDAAPPNFSSMPEADAAGGLHGASSSSGGQHAGLGPDEDAYARGGEEFAKAVSATRKTMKNPFTRWDRQMSSLNKLTVGERVEAERHTRALQRWENMKKEWEKFRGIASKVTDRPKEALTITAAEEYRERVELMDLIDRATPDFIKSGGYGWYQSLREYGARLVTIGNIFSGLYLYIKLRPNANGQIIRKPWLRELAYYRAKNHSHTWRDNPFLVARKKRYAAAMEMMNPGLLGLDEVLEIDGVGAERLAKIAEGAVEEKPTDAATAPEEAKDTDAEPLVTTGPAVELEPSRLEFHCLTGEKDTAVLTIRNTGSTLLFWELEELPPQKFFEETICPTDPTRRFQTHVVKGKIFPGNEEQICVTFLSATAGSFTSRWRLKTNPNMTTEEYLMHGVSYWRHADIISGLQQQLHDQQVESQCSEQVEDLFGSIDVTAFPAPDFDNEAIRALFFEERNGESGLHYRSEYFTKLMTLLSELREFARQAGMENQILWKDDRGRIYADYEYGDHVHYSEEDHAGARGHLPITHALEAVPVTFGPDFEWDLRVQELRDILRDVEPQNPDSPEAKSWRRMMADLTRLTRFFASKPLERSSSYPVLEEEAKKFSALVIDEWTTAKAAVPDPEDADAVEAARDAFCESFSLLSERTKTVTNEEGEAVEEPYFSTILDKSVEQVLGAGELRCRTFSSTSQAVTSYRKKMTTENADSGGQVVLYEMDLGSIAGVEAIPKKGGEEGEMTYELDGPHINDLTTRLETGLTDIIAANPKALFISAHVDSTIHASSKSWDGEGEPPVPTSVPGCPSFLEDLDLMIKKITGVPCEFVTLEEISTPEFAAEIRKEVEDEEELKTIYLIENLSMSYEELGGRRIDANYERFPWARRENWVDSVFKFGVDVYIQDSFSMALRDDCTTQKYLSWDRPGLPARVVGPFVDAEMQNLISEVLKMPENAGGGSTAEHTATEGEEGEEAEGDGLQLQIVGGMIDRRQYQQHALEKVSLIKNTLEELSQLCFCGGDLILVLLRFVFDCGEGWFKVPSAADPSVNAIEDDPSFSTLLREKLADAVQNADRTLLVPIDFVLEEDVGAADGEEPKKPTLLQVGGTTVASGAKIIVHSAEITYGVHMGKCLVLETQDEKASGVWNACGRISLVEKEVLRTWLAEADEAAKAAKLAAEAAAAEEEGEVAEGAAPAEGEAAAEGDEDAPASPFAATYVGSIPADAPEGLAFADVGPQSVAQVKRVLCKSKAVVTFDRLAVTSTSSTAASSSQSSSAGEEEGAKPKNAKSDLELWDFIELRMQPVEEEEEEGEEEEEEEDEDGNPLPRKEKPPKPEKWAEFETSMFVGKELGTAVVAYKPEHSYSLVVDKIPEGFLHKFLSGAGLKGIACLGDKAGKKRPLKPSPK